MKSLWFKLLPLLFVCIMLAAGCAGKKVVTEDMASADAQAEVVPDGAVASEGPSAVEQAEEMAAGEGVETSSLGEEDAQARAITSLYAVHFDFDKYNIRDEDAEHLRRNASWLKKNPGVTVTISGHADERGETEYNLALGDRRAKSVKGFLTGLGVDPSRLKTISYGEEKPEDPGHDEQAWAKNRRAEFELHR